MEDTPAAATAETIASTTATIAKNTAFLTIGELGTRVFSFVLVVAIARYLGDVGLGAFAFAFAFADLLLNFVDLGVPMYILREMAKNRPSTKTYTSNVLGLRLLMAPAILLIGVAAAFLINASTSQTRLVIILATIGMIFNFLTEPLRMIFLAHEKAAYYSSLIILERLSFTLGGLALLVTGHGLVPVIGAYIASEAISLLTTAFVVREKFARFTVRFNYAAISSMLKGSFSFWIANFLRMVYQRADTLMLSAIQGFAVTGWYGAAYKITEALRFIPLVVISAVFPPLSRLHAKSKENVKAVYERTLYYVLIAALPMAIGLTLIAKRVILFFYGASFTPSIIALQLLVWAEALFFIHYLMGFMLSAIDKQRLFTITTALYVGANLLLNIILIPKYSYVGAGTAAVTTQLMAVALLSYFTAKNGYGVNFMRIAYKPLISAGAMAAALIWLKSAHLLIAAPAAAAVYLAVLALVRGIGREELQLIRKAIARN